MASVGLQNIVNDEISFLQGCLKDFKVIGTYCYGFTDDNYEDIIEQYLSISSTCFVTKEAHFKSKGHTRFSDRANPIFEHNGGNVPISMFGKPFIIMGTETRHCVHGSEKDARGGWKKTPENEHSYGRNRRMKIQGTRKLNCPAMIQVRQIKVFNDFELSNSLSSSNQIRIAKQKTVETLKEKLGSDDVLNTSFRYYVKIPVCKDHCGHPVGENARVNQTVDKRIIARIYELVEKNVTSIKEVKRCLDEFVLKELFVGVSGNKLPKKTNRKYYPSSRDIRNHVARAVASTKYCSDDQEALLRKIQNWKISSPTANYFLRPEGGKSNCFGNTVSSKNSSNFLFVHQEEWQRKLLLKYGSDLALLDATYKTTKYAMPLFFLCVNTNVGYKVVAEFMCQHEDEVSISEALGILQQWNPQWKPKYFMVDFSAAEIGAIEAQFPGVIAYICDFHRQQAIQRWARTGRNGLDENEQEFFQNAMTKIGSTPTEREYKEALSQFRQSKLYKIKGNVRYYIDKTWIPCAFRWCHAFRKSQVLNIVNTNNGVESLNRLFKYDYLPRSIDKSLYGIVVLIVTSFLPETYQAYRSANLRFSGSYRKYNTMVPEYLENRPPNFIKHCLKTKFAAQEFCEDDVICVNHEKGEFVVKSATSKLVKYQIKLSQPRCTCESWRRTTYPCKHFFAIFNFFSGWQFDNLPPDYRNSVFITLDNDDVLINEREMPTVRHPPPPLDLASTCPIDTNIESAAQITFENSQVPEINTSPASTPSLSCDKLKQQFQEKLSGLKNVSYLVEDINLLEDAIAIIDDLQVKLLAGCPEAQGLFLRGSPEKKKLKITSTDYHKVFHKRLSLRRKRKNKVNITTECCTKNKALKKVSYMV